MTVNEITRDIDFMIQAHSSLGSKLESDEERQQVLDWLIKFKNFFISVYSSDDVLEVYSPIKKLLEDLVFNFKMYFEYKEYIDSVYTRYILTNSYPLDDCFLDTVSDSVYLIEIYPSISSQTQKLHSRIFVSYNVSLSKFRLHILEEIMKDRQISDYRPYVSIWRNEACALYNYNLFHLKAKEFKERYGIDCEIKRGHHIHRKNEYIIKKLCLTTDEQDKYHIHVVDKSQLESEINNKNQNVSLDDLIGKVEELKKYYLSSEYYRYSPCSSHYYDGMKLDWLNKFSIFISGVKSDSSLSTDFIPLIPRTCHILDTLLSASTTKREKIMEAIAVTGDIWMEKDLKYDCYNTKISFLSGVLRRYKNDLEKHFWSIYYLK